MILKRHTILHIVDFSYDIIIENIYELHSDKSFS